jgi:hypothetical protein
MSRFTTIRPTRALSALRVRGEQGAKAPRWVTAVAVTVSATLSACAVYSTNALKVGDGESTIIAQMGAPTARYTLPGGQQRLEYARGPYGKHTYMLTLDAAGRLQANEQVLTEPRFATILPGMLVVQVRTELGQPAQSRVGWRGVGEVWSYRYDATFCQWFQVWLVDGAVREAAYAPDPLCDVDRDDKHGRLR